MLIYYLYSHLKVFEIPSEGGRANGGVKGVEAEGA